MYKQPPSDSPFEGRQASKSTFVSVCLDRPLIGIIDTGFRTDALQLEDSRILWGRNFVDRGSSLIERNGRSRSSDHGTRVLSAIMADQDSGIGVHQPTHDVRLWLGSAVGSGKWAASLVEFVDAAKELRQTNAVINLSFDLARLNSDGSLTTRLELTTYERAALTYAQRHGTLIVVAAGNQGGVMSALGQASQEFDNLITVGAAEGLSRAPYSSFGEGLTLLADGSSLRHLPGTSTSAARVTEAVSQIWAANPQLGYHQVADILKATALAVDHGGWTTETGFGLLNVRSAIDVAIVTAPISEPASVYLPIPVLDESADDNTAIERPAWFGEDAWGTVVDVATFPYKKAAEAAKFLTDKAGDGIKFGLDELGIPIAGDVLDSVLNKVGEEAQGIVERDIEHIRDLPSELGRTAEDLFSDELWNNLGSWVMRNAINIAELAGLPEVLEAIAELIKFNTRPLTDAEKALARSVFGDSINLEAVRIDELSFGSLYAAVVDDANPRPFTTLNTINSWGSMDDATLIHELTHVWQYHHVGAIYIPEALAAQNSGGFTGLYPPDVDPGNPPGYRYGGYTELENRMAHGGKLTEFTFGSDNTPNHEQQAKIVEDYFKIRADNDPTITDSLANDEFLAIYAYFVDDVSDRSLANLIPAPYGLVLGSDRSDGLTGDSRNETLVGFAGDDTINGGAGNDRMYGGLDDDTYFVDSSQDVIVEYPGEGTDQVGALASYTLSDNVENLTLIGTASIDGTGNALKNVIIGNDANNILIGAGEDDFIDGRGGIDTVDYSSATLSLGMTADLSTGVAFDGINGIDTLRNVENVVGSQFSDRILGDSRANTVSGGGGNDEIDGRAGNDVLIGGTGNDHLVGGDGNDTLDGGTGDDTMEGGDGNDTYVVDSSADRVLELLGTGVDTVISSITWDLRRLDLLSPVTNTGLENLTLMGNALNGTGNELNNTIRGNDLDNTLNGLVGNDTLFGNGGNDRLMGGDGNDSLDGGTGNDTMIGGNGNDTYVVDSTADRIMELPGTGIDTVISSVDWDLRRIDLLSPVTNTGLENLTLTGNATNGTGNELNNTLRGNSSNNTLSGNAGNDVLVGAAGNDTLNGGTGDDVLTGGDGTDTLFGGAGNDQLSGGNGADRFRYDSGRAFDVADLGVDTITDFAHNVDKIILDKTTFNTISSAVGTGFSLTGEFSRFVGSNASAEVRAADIVYNSTTGDLFFNANGSAGGFGIGGLFATLIGAPTLSANDFLIVA